MRHKRNLARLFLILSVIAWAAICIALVTTSAKADVSPDDGGLPGDDTPALVRCYMTDEEVQEDFENQKIEDALLADSQKLEDVTVTYYCICEICCGKSEDDPAYGITASGLYATPGVSVAVDPDIIPLGSDILLDYGDGELHYMRADDTGSGVEGNHIDVCLASHEEALRAGVRSATVYLVPANV